MGSQALSRLNKHHSPLKLKMCGESSVVFETSDRRGPNTMNVKEMEVKEQVGDAAGEVWRLLNQGGPQTLVQLKKKLNGSGDLLGFAVGWLAREDKVEVVKEKRSILLRLK
jgi:hypothetical protein